MTIIVDIPHHIQIQYSFISFCNSISLFEILNQKALHMLYMTIKHIFLSGKSNVTPYSKSVM